MSFIGKSPSVRRTRYTPQATDPVNPADGDFFFSNGTPRDEGPWVYFDGAWQQVTTSGALNSVNDLTFIPQSSDPGSPTDGMVFFSDGTPRAEGLWLYDGSDWVQLSGVRSQEFALKAYITARVATTAPLTLASQVENGDTIDGVVLATNDIVLIKDQISGSENGPYTVNVSGPPTRHTSADTFTELNNLPVIITAGTVNTNTVWYQQSQLTSLSDAQVWATTPGNRTMVVPGGVYFVELKGVGGGGAGGVGGNGSGSGGGGGGAGAAFVQKCAVVPGETLTISLGKAGLAADTALNVPGGSGGDTVVVGSTSSTLITFRGGGGGGYGIINGTDSGAGADSIGAGGAGFRAVGGDSPGGGGGGSLGPGGVCFSTDVGDVRMSGSLGGGGAGAPGLSTTTRPATAGGGSMFYPTGGAAGGASTSNRGSGGGGGSGLGVGGAGATATSNAVAGSDVTVTNTGAGGGGGGAGSGGGKGGRGGTGYCLISW